jgi:hypothetical protein
VVREGLDSRLRGNERSKDAWCSLQLAFVFAAPAVVGAIDATDVRVIDGDTIRVFHKRPNVRLVGFNAPETRRPAERELGAKATRCLRDIVCSHRLDFRFVPCACRPGTEGTQACNFGRRCEKRGWAVPEVMPVAYQVQDYESGLRSRTQ